MTKQYDLIRGLPQMEKAIITDGKPGSIDTDNGFINLLQEGTM